MLYFYTIIWTIINSKGTTMFNKFITSLHSRTFNFAVLPFLVICLFLSLVHWGDIATRALIVMQYVPLAGLAYLISKGLGGKVSSEDAYDAAMKNNTGAGLVYIGIMIMRTLIFFTLCLAFAISLNGNAG